MEVCVLKIMMVGIDYKSAGIEVRENVSFVQGQVRNIIKKMKEQSEALGVAMISTCNRTEVYFSTNQIDNLEPIKIFCDATGLEQEKMKNYFYVRKGNLAINYLFELTCGIHSLIFGEDQIITQVKDAISIANHEKVSDANLNTIFRCAVTCAKKVKTNLVLKSVCPSVANQAVEFMDGFLSDGIKKKVLIIGNGVIGRKVCEELLRKKCDVFMTLRSHSKNKNIIIPPRCNTVEYNQRQKLISQVDVLISATTSPHYTITYDMIKDCTKRPKFIIDLAVPRDIEPNVNSISGVIYRNIDTLGGFSRKDNSREIAAMREFIDTYMQKIKKWSSNREKVLLGCCQG